MVRKHDSDSSSRFNYLLLSVLVTQAILVVALLHQIIVVPALAVKSILSINY